MKWLIFSLLVFGYTLGFSQPNWKDSTIAKKYKPLDAYELDGLVYFKTQSGWGVFWPAKSNVLIKPAFQFILSASTDPTKNFYVVKKGKIQVVGIDGKPIDNKLFEQLGEYDIENKRCLFKNGKAFFSYYDLPATLINYQQFTDGSERSLIVKSNLVFMNVFQKGSKAPIRVTRNGVQQDSLNIKGKVVKEEFLPKMSSAVYDLKTGQWIVPVGAAKVGSCGNNIIIKDVVKKGIRLEEQISVLDKTFQKIGSFSFEEAKENPKAIKTILSDFNPVSVEKCFEENALWRDDLYNARGILPMFRFETETKPGLYYPWFFEVVVRPDKYDFVFMPNAFTSDIYTIKDSKVGFHNAWGNKNEYSNLYNKLDHTGAFVNPIEIEVSIMKCDDSGAESTEKNDTTRITRLMLNELFGFVRHASIELNDDHVIVHDFIPKEKYPRQEPIMVPLPDGTWYDSVRVDETGEMVPVYRPVDLGVSAGGVYSLSAKKWIVPRKFSKIIKTASGFSCVRKFNDTVLLSYYSHAGKEIFKGLTADSLIRNTDLLSKFTGVKFTGSLKVKFAPNNYNDYDGRQILFTEAKRCGVFDIYNLVWVIKPENELVDLNFTTSTFTIMQNGRMGLCDIFGQVMAQPLYDRIEYRSFENGFILNDSLFCYGYHPFKTVPVDSAIINNTENQDYERAYTARQVSWILDKKLVVSESAEIRDYIIDPITFDNMSSVRIPCYSRSVDIRNFEVREIKNAVTILPWKDGFLLKDDQGYWEYENNKGNRTIISKTDNVRISKDHIYTVDVNHDYIYSESGNGNIYAFRGNFDLNEPEDVRRIAGYRSTYFDGEKIIELPKEFILLALNKNGTGLGYTMTKEPKGDNHIRKYCYYDLNTKQFSNCAFEFASHGRLEIAEVNGYFVFMDTDRKKNLVNVWQVEQDLKTIKSSFEECAFCNYQLINDPFNHIILFEVLSKTKKQMFFDREFQFMLEAPEKTYEVIYPAWDRLVLKSAKKAIQMNLRGQMLNK